MDTLTGLFKCQLLAPHGGVFVFATIQPLYNIPLYLLSVVAGSFVTAILLGILKKDHPTPELGKWILRQAQRELPTPAEDRGRNGRAADPAA